MLMPDAIVKIENVEDENRQNRHHHLNVVNDTFRLKISHQYRPVSTRIETRSVFVKFLCNMFKTLVWMQAASCSLSVMSLKFAFKYEV